MLDALFSYFGILRFNEAKWGPKMRNTNSIHLQIFRNPFIFGAIQSIFFSVFLFSLCRFCVWDHLVPFTFYNKIYGCVCEYLYRCNGTAVDFHIQFIIYICVLEDVNLRLSAFSVLYPIFWSGCFSCSSLLYATEKHSIYVCHSHSIPPTLEHSELSERTRHIPSSDWWRPIRSIMWKHHISIFFSPFCSFN